MTHCPFVYVYVCVHVYAGWYTCMCVPVWRSEINLGCRTSVVNHIVFDAASGSALKLTFELCWPGQSPSHPPVPASSALDFQMHTIKAAFMWGFPRLDVRVGVLEGKLFPGGAAFLPLHYHWSLCVCGWES